MKTVQEVLRETDKEELVERYLNEYPISLQDFDDDVTIGDAKQYARLLIGNYIERLRTLKTKPSDDNCIWIFYVYHYEKDGVEEPSFNLTSLNELRDKGIKAASYAVEWTEQAEILGYYIAENELTNYYLTDLLVDILYEASFFGIEQEDLPKEKRELDQAIEEVESGDTKTVTYDEMVKELGLGEMDQFSSEEKKYRSKVFEYQQKIADSSNQKAIQEILQDVDSES